MRLLHFFEHVTESDDPLDVQFFAGGYPLIAPGENGDASVDTFFSGWSFALYDPVGPGPGDCPDDPGKREAPEQYGDSDSD